LGKIDRKDIASQRIERLLELAEKCFSEDEDKSHRYAELAWKIKLKSRINIPKKWRRRICRNCKRFLKPGPKNNCKIRIYRSKVIIKCMECGYKRRFPLNE